MFTIGNRIVALLMLSTLNFNYLKEYTAVIFSKNEILVTHVSFYEDGEKLYFYMKDEEMCKKVSFDIIINSIGFNVNNNFIKAKSVRFKEANHKSAFYFFIPISSTGKIKPLNRNQKVMFELEYLDIQTKYAFENSAEIEPLN